jgi:hypothetical protein
MILGETTATQAGLIVLAAILAPAALIFLASGLSNLSVRFWRGRMADSDEPARRIQS